MDNKYTKSSLKNGYSKLYRRWRMRKCIHIKTTICTYVAKRRPYLGNGGSYKKVFEVKLALNFKENHFLLMNFFNPTTQNVPFSREILRYFESAVAQKGHR